MGSMPIPSTTIFGEYMSPAVARLRPAVARFAGRMESRLVAHDAEQGTLGWCGADTDKLLESFDHHIIRMRKSRELGDKAEMVKQAINAANYLMMVVDNVVLNTEAVSSSDTDVAE